MHKAGHPLEDSLVKQALSITKKKPGFSGLFAQTETDTEHLDRYKLAVLSERDFPQLKEEYDQGGIYDEEFAFVLFREYPSKIKQELREQLESGFENYFSTRLNELERILGGQNETFKASQKQIPFLRRRLTTAALEALCGLKQKTDLDLVRYVLDSHSVDICETAIEFLGKFGD